jgi:hypothetical protein
MAQQTSDVPGVGGYSRFELELEVRISPIAQRHQPLFHPH